MADPKPPKSRPEPRKPDPSVYGGRWGGSGKQGDPPGQGKVDRPERVEPSKEKPGAGEADGPLP